VKAATYCRVSTEEQVQNGTSLETQRARTRGYVEEKGWAFVEEFTEEGVSGAKESRPELDRLLDACRAGEVEVVVVTKHDRFARSLLNALLLMRDLDEMGVVVEFTDEPNETGLIRNLRFAIAEDERQRIVERTSAGKRAIKAQGYWIGGRVPFGFTPVSEGARKRLVVDEFEAESIRLAATLLVDQRCSTHEVAERLNGLGRVPRTAARWDHMLLRHMLRRRIVVPDILTEERFAEVQAVLEATGSGPQRERDHVYPLSLRLFGMCGAPYRGVYRKELATPRRYYTCKNKDWEQRATRCEDRALHAEDIEYVVWEQVCDVLSQPERLLSLAEEYLGLRGQQVEFERDSVADLDAQIAKQEKVLTENVVEAVKAGQSASVIQSVTAQLTNELDALRRHRKMLDSWREESARESQRMRHLWELAEGAHKRLPHMSPQEQKEMLDLLDVRVTVLEHGTKESPTRVRVEGVVGSVALTNAAREIDEVEPPRGSARGQEAEAAPPATPARR
jgi:DNA invertase Pin-like site-specific DNA recombinase